MTNDYSKNLTDTQRKKADFVETCVDCKDEEMCVRCEFNNKTMNDATFNYLLSEKEVNGMENAKTLEVKAERKESAKNKKNEEQESSKLKNSAVDSSTDEEKSTDMNTENEDRFQKYITELENDITKYDNRSYDLKTIEKAINKIEYKCTKDNYLNKRFKEQNEIFEEETEIEQTVEDKMSLIKTLLKENQVVLIQGNTGCGKTTKIPRLLLDEYEKIVCTQPRRLAAINVARKVSRDMNCEIGTDVGYSVRFDDKTTGKTKLKFVTDGLLINEIVNKKEINTNKIANYDLIIIDEAHERTINIDYLLGYIKEKQKNPKNKTKLLLMSATMNAEKLCEFFNCPVVVIKHKRHPLTYFYMKRNTKDYLAACVDTATAIINKHEHGDILVFLSGQDEIDWASDALKYKCINKKVSILKLYSSMLPKEQDLVFSIKTRKVILATNIAETSITISGIKFVVDSGKFKCKNHLYKQSIDLLKVTDISSAQADQRAGRAGRTQAGQVFRIYTKKHYEGMVKYTEPEIVRSKLSSVVLSMKCLGLQNVQEFEFIDKPSKESIQQAELFLYHLRAMDMNGCITELGRKLARLPVEPDLAMSLLYASENGCFGAVATIAAFLQFQSPFVEIKPGFSNYQSYLKKISKFNDDKGTLYTYLKIYKQWEIGKFSIKFLQNNFLMIKTMQDIRRIREQLLGYFSYKTDSNTNIEDAFIAGFFMNIAKKEEKNYRAVFGNFECFMHQKEPIYAKYPKYLIFCKLFMSAKIKMKKCLEINPDTICSIVNNKNEEKCMKKIQD